MKILVNKSFLWSALPMGRQCSSLVSHWAHACCTLADASITKNQMRTSMKSRTLRPCTQNYLSQHVLYIATAMGYPVVHRPSNPLPRHSNPCSTLRNPQLLWDRLSPGSLGSDVQLRTSKRQSSTEDFHQIPDLCLRSAGQPGSGNSWSKAKIPKIITSRGYLPGKLLQFTHLN